MDDGEWIMDDGEWMMENGEKKKNVDLGSTFKTFVGSRPMVKNTTKIKTIQI